MGERDIAARSLELVREDPLTSHEDREKTLVYEAKLLRDLGLPDAAEVVYDQFLGDYANSPRAAVVREKLARGSA